jgi:HlyD family secretion protein
MKIGRIIAAALFILVLVGSTACSLGQGTAAQTQVAVSKGDLTVKVNGTGKTGYATDAKLAFGSAGKIETVFVKKGDSVTKGTVLANLDTNSLELALTQAQTAEAQARVVLSTSQLNQTQAEAALTTAQFNLDRTKAVQDIKDDITGIEWTIKATQINLTQALSTGETSLVNALNQYISDNQKALSLQQKKLQDLLAKDEYTGVATYEIGGQKYDRLIVEDVRMKEQQVQLAQQTIEQVKLTVEQAQLSLTQATQAVAVTRKQLADAAIVAPFDGTVAGLDIKPGDFVITPGLTSVTPIYMVGPQSLEISTEVDEIDVANIKLGQKVVISLDALPNAKFDGTVTSISLTPVVKPQNSGVVVYEVKVGFVGAPPVEAKSGMSVSVDIVTQEKKNVMLVPNKSIKKNAQGQTTVNLVVNQKVEERPVTLGLTDGTQTEVVSGLSEGDMIVKVIKENGAKTG